MRFFSHLCLFFCLSVPLMTEHSIFHEQMFYQEMLKRVDAPVAVVIRRLMDHGVFADFGAPRTNAVLREFERIGVIKDWIEHRVAFVPFVRDDLLSKSEERRYFYLREAFRQTANSTVDKILIGYVNDVASSDFLAILADIQFRSLLAPLAKLGFMEKFFSCVGDVSFFYSIPDLRSSWETEFKKNIDVMEPGEAKIISLLTIVRSFPQEVRDRAARIRDSAYFSMYYDPEVQRVVNSDLFGVFEGFFQRGFLGDKVQKLYETGLLLQAIEKGNSAHEKYARRLLEVYAAEDNMRLMQTFLQSAGFAVFFDPKWAAEMHYLNRNGVLLRLSESADDLAVLLSPDLADIFNNVEKFYLAESERLHSRSRRRLQQEDERNLCHENMLTLMQGRERYTLKYREEPDLNDPEKKMRYLKFLEASGLRCPSGGEYHSTEHGWIYCNKHGKAPIPDYERADNSNR